MKPPGGTRDLLHQTVENHYNIRKLLEIITAPINAYNVNSQYNFDDKIFKATLERNGNHLLS